MSESATNLARRWRALRHCQRRLGFFAGLRWFILQALDRHGLWVPAAVRVLPKSAEFPLRVRMKGSSDVDVFEEIFLHDSLPLDRFPGGYTPKLIMDIGANAGFSAAAFLFRYPDAFVLAVEPDPANVACCRENLAPYGIRARLVEAAVWHSRTRLTLSRGTFGDGREWATQVLASDVQGTGDVEALTIPDLLSLCPQSVIDLLKIDIEGSEIALFSHGGLEWLNKVRHLCIEIHGEVARQTVMDALNGYTFELTETPDYCLFANLRPR